MIRKFTYITIAPIFLVLSLFLISATPFFYQFQYNKNNTYQVVDIPESEMPIVINHLNRYLSGLESEFNHKVIINGQLTPVYNDREVRHMSDVRVIFDFSKYMALIFAMLIMLMLYKSAQRDEASRYLINLSSAGIIGMVVITIALLCIILTDFSSAFTTFHHIFFTNDLWLLDPKIDRLIQMLPQIFFKDIALSIIGLSFVIAVLFKLLVYVMRERTHA